MTREYALLSLRAGFLAAAINSFGGGSTIESIRGVAWQLTSQLIADLQRKALDCGVPQEILDQIDHTSEAVVETMYPSLMTIQDQSNYGGGRN